VAEAKSIAEKTGGSSQVECADSSPKDDLQVVVQVGNTLSRFISSESSSQHTEATWNIDSEDISIGLTRANGTCFHNFPDKKN
jgi:hypothetical protein